MWPSGEKYYFSLACLTWIPRKNNIDMFICGSTVSGNCFVLEDDFKEKMPKKIKIKNLEKRFKNGKLSSSVHQHPFQWKSFGY